MGNAGSPLSVLLDGPPGGSMGFGLSGDFTSYTTTISKAARMAVLL